MDHCTLWFDRFLWWDWSACCAAHDSDYAIGVVKVIADYFLRSFANAALPGMGEVMWWGIAVIGGAISKWFYDKAARERGASTQLEGIDMFNSKILAGFKCAHLGWNGHDLLHGTGHVPVGSMRRHYNAVLELGVQTARVGLPWRHGVRERMQVAHQLGIQVIWDMDH